MNVMSLHVSGKYSLQEVGKFCRRFFKDLFCSQELSSLRFQLIYLRVAKTYACACVNSII